MPREDPETAIRQYADLVYRIAYAQTHQRCDADDLFQEVFSEVLPAQARLRQRGTPQSMADPRDAQLRAKALRHGVAPARRAVRTRAHHLRTA